MPINNKVKEMHRMLQSAGADVGNENEFNDWFFARGEEGYKNRKYVFDTFKQAGADVGENYEEFAGLLNLQPEGPDKKGGRIGLDQGDMSDFQKTIDNANQTLGQTRQTVNRIGNRQQRIGLDLPRTDFGRVNLGENRKVTKGQQYLNPETGQLEETYVTQQGNEYESRGMADLEQNSVDQQEWEINNPKEALRRRIDSQIADIEAKRKELTGPGGAPRNVFTNMYAGGQGAPVQRTADDQRLDDLTMALKDLTDARTRMERGEQLQASSDFLGGVGVPFTKDWFNNWKNFGYGVWDALSDPGLYDFGISDVAKAGMYGRIKRKIENGEELSDTETALALAGMAKAQTEQMVTLPHGYTAGVTTTEMAPFMAQMAMSPLSGTGRALARKAVRTFGRDGLKAVSARVAARALGNLAEAGVLSNTLQAGKTAADIMSRYSGDSFAYDDDGNLKIGYYEEGPDGEAQFVEGGKSALRSVYEGEAASIIENFTELGTGGKINGLLSKAAGSKLGQKMGLGYISDLISKVGTIPFAKASKKFLKTTHYDGLIEEPLEEEYGIVLNAMLGTGDAKISDLWDSEKQADIFAGTMWFGGVMAAMNTAAYPFAKRQMKRNLNNADVQGEMVFGDEWPVIKTTIDNVDDKDIAGFLYGLKDDDKFSNEQKAAIFGYAARLKQYQGANVADMLMRMEGNLSEGDTMVKNAYDLGTEAETPDEKKSFVDEAQAAQDNLSQYGKEFAIMATAGSDNPANTLDYMMSNRDTYSDEEIAAAADYYQKQARAQGVMDAAIDGVDLEVEKANAEVRSNTHQQTGDVITAQMGDGAYYLIGGDVATDEETGMPVVVGTGGAAVVKDAVTGEVSVVPAQQVTVTSMTSADEMIHYNDHVLRQQLMQQADDDITFGSPANEVFDLEDTVTLQDGNGGVIEGQVVTLPNAVDGVFVIQTADGRALQMTADDINRRIVAHNGQEVQRATQLSQSPSDQVSEEVSGNNGGISPVSESGGQISGQISGQNQQGVTEPTEVTAPAEDGGQVEGTQSALSRIPVRMDEKGQPMTNRKGKPVLDWNKASTEDAAAALVETTEGDLVMARDNANRLVNTAKAKLEKIRKQEPKGEDPLELADSAKAKKQAEQEQQDIIRKWQDVAATIGRRINEESERKRLEAEAAKSEEQRQREAEEARILKEKQDEIDRQRLREAIERDHEKRNREYEPLVRERQELADDAEALSILNDTEPRSLEEWVSSLLRPHSMLWQDASESERGLQSELGYKRADMQRMMSLLGTKENGAKPFGMITDEIHEGLPEAMKEMYDTEDVRRTLLDLFNEGSSTRMMHLTEEHRIEQARETARENARRDAEAEMEAWAEAYHLTPEERETFEDFMAMPPMEGVESEILNQIIAEHDEQNRSSQEMGMQPASGTVSAGTEGGEGQVRQTVEAAGNGNPQQGTEQGTEAVTGEPPVVDNNVPGGTSIFVTPVLDVERSRKLVSDLADAYASRDPSAIQQAADEIKAYVNEGGDFENKEEDLYDYDGNDPQTLAVQYKQRVLLDRYLDDDEDQEYIRTGLKPDMRQSEQLKPTDLRDAVRPESAELGVNEANARARYQLSSETDAEGNRFYEKDGSIDLWTLPELFARARRQAAPIRLTDRNLQHILNEHHKEIGNEDDVLAFLDDIFSNAPVLRKARGRGMFVVVEQDNTDKAAIIKLMPSETGDYYNVETAGYYRKDKWKEYEDVIADLREPGQSDAVADVSKPQTPDENGGEPINAETQTSSSEGKGTENISNNQENQQKSSDLGKTSSPKEIAEEESKVNTNPTEGQKEAGNYQMGHINIDGYDITIENPKGSIRSGVDGNGKAWSQEMHNTYGYIRGTEGVDGDHIDVFLSDDPTIGDVFVVDQVNPETGEFDEHKVMYGFADAAEAAQAYLSNYEPGWKGLGAISGVSRVEFKKWVESSHRKTKPFREYALAKREQAKQEKAKELPSEAKDAIEEYERLLDEHLNIDPKDRDFKKKDEETLNRLNESRKKVESALRTLTDQQLTALKDATKEKAGHIYRMAAGEMQERVVASQMQEVFDKGIEKQGEIEGSDKGKPARLEDYVANVNPNKPILDGVYEDPDGYAVVTDGFVLLADKQDYDKRHKGQVLTLGKDAGKRKEGKYPDWKRVVNNKTNDYKQAKVDVDGLLGFLSGVNDRLKAQWKKARDAKETRMSFKDWSSNAEVFVRMPDGTVISFRPNYLRLFAQGMKKIGADKIEYLNIYNNVRAQGKNGYTLVQPLVSFGSSYYGADVNRFFYDLGEGGAKTKRKLNYNDIISDIDENGVSLQERLSKSYTDREGVYHEGLEEELGRIEDSIRNHVDADMFADTPGIAPGDVSQTVPVEPSEGLEAGNGETSGGQPERRTLADLRRRAALIRAELARRKQKESELRSKYNISKDGDITLDDLARMFRDLNSDEAIGKLFDRVYSVLKKLKVSYRFTDKLPGGVNGRARTFLNSTLYDLDAQTRDMDSQKKAKILLHEMIHNATDQILLYARSMPWTLMLSPGQYGAARKLNRIFEQVRDAKPKRANGKDFYALESVDEMVAELANPEFREALDGITVDGRSLWQRIKDAVRQMLGMDKSETESNALDEASSALDSILDGYNWLNRLKHDIPGMLSEKILGSAANESVEEEKGEDLLREGDAAKTVPINGQKMTAKQKRQRQAYAERQWKAAHDRARETVDRLNIGDIVTVVDSIGDIEGSDKFSGRKKVAKGWYDPDTNRIFVVIGNHRSPQDVIRTILHEAVAHYGLRQLFGDNFDTFLDNVYNSSESAIRKEIDDLADRYGGDTRRATEEYLARLAEDTDFERAVDSGWWKKIQHWFLDMLKKVGIADGIPAYEVLTDNDLRYILWRSHQNLSEPGRYRNVFQSAQDTMMQSGLGVGNHARTVRIPVKGRVEDELPKMIRNRQDEVSIEKKVADMSMDEVREAYKRIDDTMRDENGLDLDEHLEANKQEYIRKNGLEGIGQFMADDLKRAMDKYGSGMVTLRWELQDRLLGAGDYAGEGKELFRDADDDVALRMYEETMARESTRRKEIHQDSMVALKAIQDAIAAETGRKATGAEDAYHFENRMHGRAKNMTEKYDWSFYRPMLKAFHDFCKAKGLTEERGLEYLISKSGLERNVYYAFRDAVKEKVAEKIKNQREKLEKDYANRRLSESEYKAKKKELAEKEQSGVDDAMQEVRDTLAYKRAKEDYASGTIGYTEYIRRIEEIVRSHVGNYDNYAKDYSGLTETFAKEMYDEAQDVRKMAQKAIDTKDRRELWKQYDQKMREAYIMARQMAEDAVFSAENDGREAADSLWERINAATKETLRHSYESGLIDRNNYNKVRDMFDFYLPLRGWDEDKASDVYSYMGKDNVFSPAVKKTWGRTSKAENPLAYIGNIAVSTILSGNRNQMKQHFLNYVLNNPTSLVSISESWYENIAPDGERPMWVLRSADTAGKSGDEIAQIVNDFNEEMQRKQREGRAMPVRGRLRLDVHATSGQKAEHVVEVQRAGRTYQLYINGNPRAAQALNGINAKVNRLRDIPKVGPFLSRLNHGMAAFFTSKNPAFVISNLSRDLNMAGASVAIRESKEYNAKFIKNVAKVLAPRLGQSSRWNPSKKQPTGLMPSLMRKWKNGTLDTGNETERYFKEFMEEGAETGFVNMLSIDSFKEKMEKEIRQMNGSSILGGKAKETSIGKALRLLGETFEFYNRCAEDATRFIVYMTSRQMGKTLEDSIADAKDVTLNFNRKGTGEGWTGLIQDTFIFVNPAIQALANMYGMAKNKPLRFGGVALGFVAGGVLMPVINQWLISMFGDDDDKDSYFNLPPWVRKNNLVFWIPFTHDFVTIPLAQEFRVFYGIGELIGSFIEKHPHQNGGMEVLESLADLVPINPTGNGGDLMVDFSPTAIQPLMQIAHNVDFTGKPIWKENQGNKYDPAYTKAYVSTPKLMVGLSEAINKATGGDEVSQGWLEETKAGQYVNNPAVWNHLLQGYLGGMYNTIAKAVDTSASLVQGELPETHRMPVVNRFLNRPIERDNAGVLGEDYWNLVGDYDKMMHDLRGWQRRAAEGDKEADKHVSDLIDSKEYRRAEVIGHYKKIIEKLRKGEKAATESADKADIKETISTLRDQMMDELSAIDGGKEPMEAAREAFDNAKTFAEKNAVRQRMERILRQGEPEKKPKKRSEEVEEALAYRENEDEESRDTDEKYLMLASPDDIEEDAKVKDLKKKVAEHVKKYKELNKEEKFAEAARYRADNVKWFTAEENIKQGEKLMKQHMKFLGKGDDARMMRLIRSRRSWIIDSTKDLLDK